MTQWSQKEGPLERKNKADPQLYYRCILPENAAMLVIIAHGYADHSERYLHVMKNWAQKRIATVAFDLRGHGLSFGPRGTITHFDEYMRDVREWETFITGLGQPFCDLPRVLFGHSFGGLLVLRMALEDSSNLKALALSAPFLDLAAPLPNAKWLMGRLASQFFPSFCLPSGILGKHLTHDLAFAGAYDSDPLVFKKANVRWFTEAKKAQVEVRSRAHEIILPLCIAFGTADNVAKYEAAQHLMTLVSSKEKHFITREGEYHEVLNERKRDELMSLYADWMHEQCGT